MKGTYIHYSKREFAWIKAHAVMTRRELHAAFCKKFSRGDVTLDHIKALCTRRGWNTGRSGRFEKGAVPANKGKKMPYNANSARTQFKKRNLPHNTKFLGHERASKDGYVEISIDEVNPHTGFQRRYVLKHKHLWEKINGPTPKGMALKCLDGNRLNTDPGNWTPVPRAMLPRLSGRWSAIPYDTAPDDMKPILMKLAQLQHKARERKPA